MSTTNRYLDRFTQKKSRDREALSEDRKVITDRDNLRSSLDFQFNHASKSNDSLDKVQLTIKDYELKFASYDENFSTVNKLIKLLQNFTESQEEENTKLHKNTKILQNKFDEFLEVQTRVERIENRLSTINKKCSDKTGDSSIVELEGKINLIAQKSIQFEEKMQSHYEKLGKDIAEDIQMLETRMSELSKKIEHSLKETQSGHSFNQKDHTHILKTVREEMNTKITSFMNELKNTATLSDLNTVEKQINDHMASTQEKIFDHIDQIKLKSCKCVYSTADIDAQIASLRMEVDTQKRDQEEFLNFIENNVVNELGYIKKIGLSNFPCQNDGAFLGKINNFEKELTCKVEKSLHKFSELLSKCVDNLKEVEDKIILIETEDRGKRKARSKSTKRENIDFSPIKNDFKSLGKSFDIMQPEDKKNKKKKTEPQFLSTMPRLAETQKYAVTNKKGEEADKKKTSKSKRKVSLNSKENLNPQVEKNLSKGLHEHKKSLTKIKN